MALVNVHTHSFFDDCLEPGGTVLDLGANIGCFSSQMRKRYGSRCIAFEPVPEHFSAIPTEIERHNLAVDAQSGHLNFNVSAQADASSFGKAPGIAYTRTITVKTVTLADAYTLARADRIALLKIDIEGSEIELLNSAEGGLLRRFDQITVEFHDFLGVTPTEIVRRTIRQVCAAGFHVFILNRGSDRYNDVVFVNKTCMTSWDYVRRLAEIWVPRAARSVRRRIIAAFESQS